MEERTAARLTEEFQRTLKRSGVVPVEIVETLIKSSHVNSKEKAQIPGVIQDFFMTKLKEAPEPTPEQLTRLMIGIRNLPLSEVREYLLHRARALPAKRGGRPKLLSKKAETDLTATISERLSIGIEKAIAIQGVAAKFGVSFWTAKRAWQTFQASMEGRIKPMKSSRKRSVRSL
jgi:hypothetical protein